MFELQVKLGKSHPGILNKCSMKANQISEERYKWSSNVTSNQYSLKTTKERKLSKMFDVREVYKKQ